MAFDQISRRRVLQGTATVAFAGALSTRAMAKDTVVGFIYVGSRDEATTKRMLTVQPP